VVVEEAHLADADGDLLDVDRVRVEVVDPRLERLAAHALLALLRERRVLRVVADGARDEADEARADHDGGLLPDRVAVRVHPVEARRQHVAPDALLALLDEDAPGRRLAARLRADDADLAGVNLEAREDLDLVHDGHDEVAALAEDLLLDALLARAREDLPGLERRAVLRDDDEHLARRDVVEERVPGEVQRDQHERRRDPERDERAPQRRDRARDAALGLVAAERHVTPLPSSPRPRHPARACP
jgi:hypothetical protein